MADNLTSRLEVKGRAKPRAKYTRRLAAGHGLTLLVMRPDGSKYGELRAPPRGGESSDDHGWASQPRHHRRQAQARAAEFRAMIDGGTDPADQRRAEKLSERERVTNTFGEAAGSLAPLS